MRQASETTEGAVARTAVTSPSSPGPRSHSPFPSIHQHGIWAKCSTQIPITQEQDLGNRMGGREIFLNTEE